MKTNIMLLACTTFMAGQSFSQSKYESYVESFPKVEATDIIRFQLDFRKENRMNREEALQFVYGGDTTKLICVRKEYNLATEKLLGISREERFPYKTILLDMGDYFLIGNTGFVAIIAKALRFRT